MKKLFSLLTIGLFAIGVNGQSNPYAVLETVKKKAATSTANRPLDDYQTRGNAIWSEDFGGGFPAGWSNDDPNAIAPWVHSLDGSNGNFSAGSVAITSTAAFGSGTPPGSNYQPLESFVTTNAIDLTGNPAVLLQFEQHFRYFNVPDPISLEVMVSNDSVTWTTWEVQGTVGTNDASGNPDLISLNISAIAGNQPTVFLKFGWSTRAYFWMIDDIRIIPLPNYDKELSFSLITHTGDGYEYGRIPENQLPTNMTFGWSVINDGALDQTNLVVDADITNAAGTTVLNSTQTVPVFMEGDTLLIENMEPTSGLAPDIYDVSFTSITDQDSLDATPTNDAEDRVFEVTGPGGLYGLDGVGIYPNPVLSALSTASFVDGADGYIMFTFFRIINNESFLGAEALLSNITVPGGEAIFSVHNAADIDAGDVFSTIAETGTIILTPQHIAAGAVTGRFNFPVNLAPGDYYVGVTLNSFGNTNDIGIIDDETVPQPFDASMIYLTLNATPGPFTNGNAFAIRLSNNPTVGVEEAEEALAAFVISPNPSTGLIRIDSPEEAKLTLEVRNMLGELVVTDQFTKTTTVDLSGYAKGVYSVRLANGTATTTQLVTLR